MMPDLARYAFEVTLAYGGSLGLLAGLVVFTCSGPAAWRATSTRPKAGERTMKIKPLALIPVIVFAVLAGLWPAGTSAMTRRLCRRPARAAGSGPDPRAVSARNRVSAPRRSPLPA